MVSRFYFERFFWAGDDFTSEQRGRGGVLFIGPFHYIIQSCIIDTTFYFTYFL